MQQLQQQIPWYTIFFAIVDWLKLSVATYGISENLLYKTTILECTLYCILEKVEMVWVVAVPFLCCAVFFLPEVIIVLIFADSGVITHPDRYLMIATSGGLNQQRTGVRHVQLSHYSCSHHDACSWVGQNM